MFSVPLDCHDAMELMVAVIVVSNAIAYHAKVPTTSLMCLMRAGDMVGEVSFSSTYFLLNIVLVLPFLGHAVVFWVWHVGIFVRRLVQNWGCDCPVCACHSPI